MPEVFDFAAQLPLIVRGTYSSLIGLGSSTQKFGTAELLDG